MDPLSRPLYDLLTTYIIDRSPTVGIHNAGIAAKTMVGILETEFSEIKIPISPATRICDILDSAGMDSLDSIELLMHLEDRGMPEYDFDRMFDFYSDTLGNYALFYAKSLGNSKVR